MLFIGIMPVGIKFMMSEIGMHLSSAISRTNRS